MSRGRFLASSSLAALVAVVIGLAAPRPIASVDVRVYDLLMRFVGGGSPSNRVAVVVVDDQSLDALGQWPWPRDVIARLVDRLRELGASVVALDMLFAEPDRGGRPEGTRGLTTADEVLARAVSDRRAVLGYALTFGPSPTVNPGGVLHPLAAAIVERAGERFPIEQLFHATGCVCDLWELSSAASASGFLNVGVDNDGTLRRVPLVMAYGKQIYPSFALSAVQAVLAPTEMTLGSRSDRTLQLVIDGRAVSLDQRGALALRFHDIGRRFDRISAANVLRGDVAAGALAGRIVFVGASAPGVRDTVSTALERQYPGIEVHATAAENLLQHSFITILPHRRVYEAAAAVGLGMLSALLFGLFGFRGGLVAGGLSLTAFWGLCTLMLGRWGTYMSPLVPTAGMMLAVAFTSVKMARQRTGVERRRRSQTHEFIPTSLTSLMDVRGASTGQHSRRTQGYSRLLLERLALTPEFSEYLTPDRVELMSMLAPLHDIGKVGVRAAVLSKAGVLTPEEMNEMRQHPRYGYETISRAQRQVGVEGPGDAAILELAKAIVYTHHERWDGTGYPRGLRGSEIPLVGRVMALVDVYDALVEARPYRRRLPHEGAVALILAGRGTQFDPTVVETFVAVSADFRELGNRLRENPQDSPQ
jgi:HD-GYP domain-containing protein (c-di-GMP phosphodiesterase class II)